MAHWVLCLRHQRVKLVCWLSGFSRGDLGEICLQTCVWQNSFSCGCRIEDPLPCWLSAGAAFSSWGPSTSPATWRSIFKSAVENLPLISSHLVCLVNLSHFLFFHQPEKKRCAFKGLTCLGRAHLMISPLTYMEPNHRGDTRGQRSWEPFKKSAHLAFIT